MEMKVILLEDVSGVGDIGQTLEVKGGFGRNYLIPKGLAFELNSRNGKLASHKMEQINAKKRRLKTLAESKLQSVKGVDLSFEVRVGKGGKVFGSVGARDIAEKLCAAGVEVDRRRILLAEPLKKVGSFKVAIRLHPEVIAETDVKLIAMEAEKDEQETGAKARVEPQASADEDESWENDYEG